MTQDEIIEMARQAGFTLSDHGRSALQVKRMMMNFAKLVAAKERARICAGLRQFHDTISLASDSSAIRARGDA
jgi:hypothetical protein